MEATEQTQHTKVGIDQLENLDNGELPQAIDKALASGDAVQMRSELDDLSIMKAVRVYWKISLICMLSAFAAALDGYREHISGCFWAFKTRY